MNDVSTPQAILLDPRLMPLPVIQEACYFLTPVMEFDLHERETGEVVVTLLPLAEAGRSPEQFRQQFMEALTRAAINRQALDDTREIRFLFGVAAFSSGTPQAVVEERLKATITPLPAISADTAAVGQARLARRSQQGPDTYRYLTAGDCPARTLLRALGRLHTFAVPSVEGVDAADGGIWFSVRLRHGLTISEWEDQFFPLLSLCDDGGLPAVFQPAFELLDRSEP